MAKKININFHQTFKPEKRYISSILECANNVKGITAQDISRLTGIPQGKSSGKVIPHLFYAAYMGLIEYEKDKSLIYLKRTPLGECVFEEDPGLQEKLTILLLHCMLLRKNSGADIWSAGFRDIFPKYRNGINKETFILELAQIYEENNINTKNIAPFFNSYEDMFESLDILVKDNEKYRCKKHLINREFVFLYAFCLMEYWDEVYPGQDEISSEELDNLNYRHSFGWEIQEEYEALELMSDFNIIRLNRQLMPYTILRLVNKDEIIARLYSELC